MRILYVEPYEGGSHASFTRALHACVPAQWTALTLPARHWKWRMRGSAVWAALSHPDIVAGEYDAVWASSYVPLAELLALCPALRGVPAILYFHENQLAYPAQHGAAPERDHHYGVTQMVSALAATRCVFNSAFNRDSFLEAGAALLRRMPDAIPPGWIEAIAARSEVLGVPVSVADVAPPAGPAPAASGPLILWSHRWEHDKNPEAFFDALRHLDAAGVPFRVAVCGQRFRRVPEVFALARAQLGERIEHWGYLDTREDYVALLQRCDIAISTARHEFFGLAMLEATHHGARPLVPDRLAYPELFGPEYRYADDAALPRALEALCRTHLGGTSLRADRRSLTRPFLAAALGPRYRELLTRVRRRSSRS
ncbi:MAG: DUF3524 domain-containing protein [Myxococcota bacterium]